MGLSGFAAFLDQYQYDKGEVVQYPSLESKIIISTGSNQTAFLHLSISTYNTTVALQLTRPIEITI